MTTLSEHKNDLEEPTNRFGLFFNATSTLSLPVERLVLKTINADLHVPGSVPDVFATACRNILLNYTWSYAFAVKIMTRQFKAFVESSSVGVPGLLTYIDARTRWIDRHVQNALRNNTTQILVLGGGFDTRSLRLNLPTNVKYFEVDQPDIIRKKKSLLMQLPAALLKESEHVRKQQLVLLSMDWDHPNALIPLLTSHGFSPSSVTCCIMEGLFPHLPDHHVQSVLTDISALCAPGSKIFWDFLHSDAFNRVNDDLYTGFANLASACANKGSPFKSGQSQSFIDWVKFTQKMHLRILEIVPPQNIAMHIVKPVLEEHEREAGEASREEADTIPLPQFYSFVSAVKTIPTMLQTSVILKDGGHELSEISWSKKLKEKSEKSQKSNSKKLDNNNEDPEVSLFTSSSFSSSSSLTSCLGVSSLLTMLWGRETDEDEGDEAEPKNATSHAPKRALSPQHSMDWSLTVADHSDFETNIVKNGEGMSINSTLSAAHVAHPLGQISHDDDGPSDNDQYQLQHAISLQSMKR